MARDDLIETEAADPAVGDSASDPFPKGKGGLRPYRTPYYVAALAILGLAAPAIYNQARIELGIAKRNLDPVGTSSAKSQAPESTASAEIAKPDGDGSAPGGAPSGAANRVVTQANGLPLPRAVVSSIRFVVGDKLKLAFYERIDSEEDKWRDQQKSARRAPDSYQMRVEFSGEFAVLNDGALVVPVLGGFAAAGHASTELQSSLTKAFEDFTGRRGLVSITVVERPPIYIVGPLKNPGAYKHVPGMTVLHVMALAGGFNVEQQMSWQLVDSAREVDKRDSTLERAKRLLAKQAVLYAERDNTAASPTARLLELAGSDEARSLVGSEANVRKLVVSSYQSRRKANKAAIELAESEQAALKGRLEPIDASLALRNERMRNFDQLKDRGLSNSNLRLQAQADVLELESRRQDAVAAIAQSKQKRALAQQELESNELAYRTDLQKEISAVDLEVPLAIKALKASDAIIGVMGNRPSGRQGSDNALSYRILRNTPSGPQFIDAELTTMVELGDVIYVAPRQGPKDRAAAVDGKG